MPTQMDATQKGYPDCPSQDPLETVNDLKSNNSDSQKPMFSSAVQEQHDDLTSPEDFFQMCKVFNVDINLENCLLGLGSNTSKNAEGDTEHSSALPGLLPELPANNAGRNDCVVGPPPCPDTSGAASCVPMDVWDTGFDPDLTEGRGLLEDTPNRRGYDQNPMDQVDEDTRLRPRSNLQCFNPERVFPTSQMDIGSPDLPKEDIFKDVPELASDIERMKMQELQTFIALNGNPFYDLQVYSDETVSLHPRGPSQISDESLDFLQQEPNSFPVGDWDSLGQPDKPGEVAVLRDHSKRPPQLQTNVWNCQEKSLQTLEPQEPPRKIARTKRMTPTFASSADGAAHSSGPEAMILLQTSAPLGVESPQQLPWQTTFPAPTLHARQPAVPPDEAHINSDPAPHQQLSAEEQRKAKRRERNKETARKAREKQKNTEIRLLEEVKTRTAELATANDEIEKLSKQQMDLQRCWGSHYCRCSGYRQAGRNPSAAQAAWHNQPHSSGLGQELAFSSSQPFP